MATKADIAELRAQEGLTALRSEMREGFLDFRSKIEDNPAAARLSEIRSLGAIERHLGLREAIGQLCEIPANIELVL